MTNIERKDLEGDNVINLEEERQARLALGGKEPPDPNNPDWLSALPIGSIFYVQDKQNPMAFQLGLCRIVDKTGKSVILLIQSGSEVLNCPVIPIIFCKKYRMFEDLGAVVTEETVEKNELNGDFPLDKE